jgi:hypothetical protein
MQKPECTENMNNIFPEMNLRGLVSNFYIHVSVNDLYISVIGPREDPLWEYIVNRSQIHECGNWETEHYNSALETMRPRSFISGIYQSEPDFYLGFSPALHLQCTH